VALTVGVSAGAADVDPADLMRQSEARHRVAFEYTKARMVLQEKDGPKREREVESWSAASDKKGDRVRIRFLAPPEVRGTGLLSLESVAGGDDEQWLYLPAFKKTRRVGQSELGDRFVGTDVFYEDLKRRRIDDYAYTLIGSETLGGQECWVIESRPSAPKVVKESPYARTRLWVRKDNLFGVRVRFFDRQNEPLKQLDATSLVPIGQQAWRADETTIIDLKRRHRTVMSVVQRNTKAPADDAFSRRMLESE
jgi:hypothetical protein